LSPFWINPKSVDIYAETSGSTWEGNTSYSQTNVHILMKNKGDLLCVHVSNDRKRYDISDVVIAL
jgi:hypothetical protein